LTIKIWTDGSCDHHDEVCPGGWAYLIIDEDGNEYEGADGCLRTTNNQMELNAILESLWGLGELEVKNEEIIIYPDSEWSIKCLTREYNCTRKQKKTGKVGGHVAWLNAIWAKMGEYKLIRFVRVPAHTDNVNNNRVNDLAVEKMKWARATRR